MNKRPWLLSIVLVFLTGSIVFIQTFSRIEYPEGKKRVLSMPQTSKTLVTTNPQKHERLPPKILAENSEKKITEPLPDKTVFSDFNTWVSDFKKLNCDLSEDCDIHDPRFLRHFLSRGESLSRMRARLMREFIRKNPQKALEFALDPDTIAQLPKDIQKNLESWESGFGDLKSLYRCTNEDHQGCEKEKYLAVNDKKLRRAYSYGQKNKYDHIRKIAYRGISLGDELALVDLPYEEISSENEEGTLFVGDQSLNYSNRLEKELLKEEIILAERRANKYGVPVRYPMIAGSNGVEAYLKSRYEVVSTPMTWEQANANATARNGRLVCIGSVSENAYILNLLSSEGIQGTDSSGNFVSFGWIGLTDDPDQNGTFLNKDTNLTQSFQLNASKGEWRWLSGDDVSQGYTDWNGGQEPNATNSSYGVIDWSVANGSWTEVDGNHVLPFVIEYDDGVAPTTNAYPIDGFRKVLVMPVRFRDEGINYPGSNEPLIDNLGNPRFPGLHQDSFEPISQDSLAATMEEVRKYYLRNSDSTFNIIPVITPTLTIDYDKYEKVRTDLDYDNETLQFDSSNTYFSTIEVNHDADLLEGHGNDALSKAAKASRKFDFYGPAFDGVVSVNINTADSVLSGNFTAPPEVTFLGGNIDPNTGLPDPDFEPAQAEAIVNAKGQVTKIRVLNSGSFYHSAPQVLLDGNDSFAVTSTFGRVAVSWVIVSSYNPDYLGLAWIDAVGSWAKTSNPNPWYPQFDSGNSLGLGVTIGHELGHNFSLQHANLYQSNGEKPNSDEGYLVGYANPYSIMGNRAPLTSGDLTLVGKVNMKLRAGFGLTLGTELGYDVGRILTPTELQDTNLTEENETGLPSNRFRIYRHDYGMGPFPLKTGEYDLNFPETDDLLIRLAEKNTQMEVHIGGPGEDAEGFVDLTQSSPKLTITSGGRGYSEEPEISILDENNQTIVRIDPNWLVQNNGLNSYTKATLRDLSENSHKGLRGLELAASVYSPTPVEPTVPFQSYWVSYRRSASEFGLSIINGYRSLDNNTLHQGLMDMTPNTFGDFTDCFLMLGHTFSDYESDIHLTPISKGGIPPMEYIEVVVNMNTSGTTEVPSFEVTTTNRTPAIGEEVSISVAFDDANESDYAYGWFTNEVMETDPENQTGNRYEWVNMRLSYAEATDFARMRGGHLACVNSAEEQIEIYALINKNLGLLSQPDYLGLSEEVISESNTTTTFTYSGPFVWLGGSDAVQEGFWQWQSGEPFKYENWGSVGLGQPNDDQSGNRINGEDALAMSVTDFTTGLRGEWNDLSVRERLTFIIEYPDRKIASTSATNFLNNPNIAKSFKEAGQHVVRIVVSDMKGAISSRNLVFLVGEQEEEEKSMITGSVRSNHGYLQGARVVIAPAEVIEHSVTVGGNDRDWFLPNGTNDPIHYLIDGQKSPTLHLNKGEIHRFRFDEKASKLGLTFFDQPESEAPRIKLNQMVTPVVDEVGDGFVTPPETNSTENGLFSSYKSTTTATIREYQDLEDVGITLGDQNETFLITRPFAKSLLSDTNLTAIRVSPKETDEFGNYIAYGGHGQARENEPLSYILRSSLWEDYSDENASFEPYVDGVGTISPVTTDNGFLGNRWERRTQNDPALELVVLGSGTDVNASVERISSGNNPTRHYHQIIIHEQGYGWEPNATMAMVHYPVQPAAMWTFDRHESLFVDPSESRFQPSPAWNGPILESKISHYWNFDEDNGTTFANSGSGTTEINVSNLTANALISDDNRSTWGVKGRALRLHSSDNNLVVNGVTPAYPFTFSAWLLPDPLFSLNPNGISFGGNDILSTQAALGDKRTYSLNSAAITRTTSDYAWGHVAVVAAGDSNYTLYIDGVSATTTSTRTNNLTINAFNGLLDELYFYEEALSETQVKALAGRLLLDLSGNKNHAVPILGNQGISTAFDMNSSETDSGFSTDVPVPANTNNVPGRLGDSFTNEDHGRSIQLYGDNYLDLSNHISTLRLLSEGTFAFWIKTGVTDMSVYQSTDNMPILSVSKSDDNDTFLKMYLTKNNEDYNFEVMMQNDGTEVTNYYLADKVNDDNWHHIAVSIDANATSLYLNGESKNTSSYAGGSGAQRAFFSDVQGADYMAIGRHFDSNVTEHFVGNLDDIYVYDRALTANEVQFLFDLRQGRDQVPRLEAIVDAVGTVKMIDNGDGYKEQPEVLFTFGQDGNLTEDLIANDQNVSTFTDLNTTVDSSRHGQIMYVEDEDQVYSYHFSRVDSTTSWRAGGNGNVNNGWREYHQAVGFAEMNATSVEGILWTKEMPTLTQIRLPDDRNVTRKYLEYVEYNGTSYSPTHGLFGYTVPPDLHLEGSPTDENASAYALFFLDKNLSAEITNPGLGLTQAGFTSDEVRISAKGFRPRQDKRKYFDDLLEGPAFTDVQANAEEEWGDRKAELTEGTVHALRLTTILKNDANFSYKSTNFIDWPERNESVLHWNYSSNYTKYDTIVGNNSTKFTQQLRVGDLLEFMIPDGSVGSPDYIVTEVLDDQNFTLAPVSIDAYGDIFFVSPAETSSVIPYRMESSGLTTDDLDAYDNDNDSILLNLEIRVYSSNHESTNPFETDHLFTDWTSDGGRDNDTALNGSGEPRNDDGFTDFNLTVSHVDLTDRGFGYYMPAEVKALGGTPMQSTLTSWVEDNNSFPIFRHATFQIESNATDVNGTILEGNSSIRVVDGGYGYATQPEIIITGGGGKGASASAYLGDRFVLPFGGSTLLSVGIIDSAYANDIGSASLSIEQNGTLLVPVQVELNSTADQISIQYNGATVNDLIAELNLTPALFDQNVTIGGDASLIQGDGTTALNELNATSLKAVSVVNVTQGGREYWNLDPTNAPKASISHPVALDENERDANLTVRLGGALDSVSGCTICSSYLALGLTTTFHEHLGPWIEIWDKGRDERSITNRALAAPKLRNGKIEKVVVVESGHGYVDPIAVVRGMPSKHGHYYTRTENNVDQFESRIWMCQNIRETKGGELKICGHVQRGLYPPENCPGEVDTGFPIGDEATDTAIEAWQERYDDSSDQDGPFHFSTGGNVVIPVQLMDGTTVDLNYTEASRTHYNVGFKARVCGGTKVNFLLLNDPYRHPYESWSIWDANLSVVTQQGKIKEIIVDSGGEMYLGQEIAVSGSGSGVDGIPVISEDGFNTMILFDDPNLKNFELDELSNPLGAGMGFAERPWSWDETYTPTYGEIERANVHTGAFDEDGIGLYGLIENGAIYGPGINWQFGNAQISGNSPGYSLMDIEVRDYGLFESNRSIDDLVISYDGSSIDGFEPAQASLETTFRLTSLCLDQNATYLDRNPQNNSEQWRWRSLYDEQPSFNIFDPDGTQIQVIDQNASTFIRANGSGTYFTSADGNYFDLYVDDRLAEEFYYGFGRGLPYLPAMGGSVSVHDPIPGLTWAVNEPSNRQTSVYTDLNGFYALPNLQPGMYNVTVFMEDENFQESSFRPDANPRSFSQIVYVPGMPTLKLVSDNFGNGQSKMLWSAESRALSRPGRQSMSADSEVYGRKVLEGIGAGFQLGDSPELIISPDLQNTSFALPKVKATGLIDGSLKLEIIDDENSSVFNPGDQFTVSFSSFISGVDFVEDFMPSLSSQASSSGSASSPRAGLARLHVFPNDGNGTNFVEVPVISTSNAGNSDSKMEFKAIFYEANGSLMSSNAVNWSLNFDFSDSNETNSSKIASLSSTNGPSTTLSLRSTLRRDRILGFEILNAGTGYSQDSLVSLVGGNSDFDGSLDVNASGAVTGIRIHQRGTGYKGISEVLISDANGSGAVLSPIFGGYLSLDANVTTQNGEVLTTRVRLLASNRSNFSDKERWLDLYADTVYDLNDSTWWALDPDNDNLTNIQEYLAATNPYVFDTDRDGLGDGNETIGILINGLTVKTSPLHSDSDLDGLSDFQEFNASAQTHPLLADTDGDGLSDGEEILLSLDPNAVDPTATIGGIIFVPQGLAGNLYVTAEANPDPLANPSFSASDLMNASAYPYVYRLKHKALNATYRVTAFIDVTGDQAYDNGEPMAQWSGELTQDVFNANFLLLDALPVLGSVGWNEQVERSDTFSLSSVFATDFPDSNWTFGQNLTAPTNISVTPSSLYILDFNDSTGMATVKSDAPYGTYDLIFEATDSVGSAASPLTKSLTILDKDPPSLVINNVDPLDWPYQYPWDPEAIDFYAYDEVDGNITNKVTGGQPSIDINTIGSTTVTLTVSDDFGNETNASFTVEIKDMTAPVISFNGDDVIDILIGEPFTLPVDYASLTDNFEDAAFLDSQLTISGTDAVNQDIEGNYSILYSVSDSSGNTGTKELTVRVSPPVHVISGVALDGYLSSSAVTFTSVNGNFTKVTTTDANGSFKLDFSGDEFDATDSNANGLLDAQEGFITVQGGVDNTTNESFGAALTADVNSTVVTPLTTVINALVQEGVLKTEAQSALSLSFGFSSQVDLAHYDPIKAAGEGDDNAKQILKSGNMAINLIKQAEAFSSIASSNLEPGTVGLVVAKQLGYAAMVSDSNLSTSLLDENFVRVVVESALTEADASTTYDSEDLQQVALIASISNAAFAQVNLPDLLPGEAAVSLAKIQVAVDTEILGEYDKIRDGTSSLSGLSSSLTADNLVAMGESFVGLNLYAPSGNSFELSIDQADWVAGKVLTTLFVFDADGDAVSVIISSGNEDLDGDGYFPFEISESLELSAGDLNDLQALNDSLVTLEFTLSDGKGKQGLVLGKVSNGSVTSQEQQVSDDQSNEADTSSSASEVSSLTIETGDDTSGTIVSNDQPIRNVTITSGNPDTDGDGVLAFKVNDSDEIVIADMDDLKTLSASEIEIILEGTEVGGGAVTLSRTLRISNALSLESVRLNSTNWIQSSWFGKFYSYGSPWVFHLRMGWLYVLPDEQSGFWFWDSHYSRWWWTSSENYPYFYLPKIGNKEFGWAFFDLTGQTPLVYEFFKNEWKIR